MTRHAPSPFAFLVAAALSAAAIPVLVPTDRPMIEDLAPPQPAR